MVMHCMSLRYEVFSVMHVLIELLGLFFTPASHVKVYGIVPSGVDHDEEYPVNGGCLT